MERSLVDLPFSERQFIVYMDNLNGQNEKPETSSGEQGLSSFVSRVLSKTRTKPIDVFTIAALGLSQFILPGFGQATLISIIGSMAGLQLVKLIFDHEGMKTGFITIQPEQAKHIKFPLGHPRSRVLYIAHPAEPRCYLPLSQFHEFIFQHKYAELCNIIASLAATEYEVHYIKGRQLTADFEPGGRWLGQGKATAELASGNATNFGYRATLKPKHTPALPNSLSWYPYENMWQSIAQARLHNGLLSFDLMLDYSDDFGVTAELEAKTLKAKLELGGGFRKFEATQWRIRGAFADIGLFGKPKRSA